MARPPLGKGVDEKKGRGRFSNAEILAILKEQDEGVTVSELCRKHGISPTTFYKWRAKSTTLVSSEANSTEPKRMTLLEEENHRLKRLLGESVLKNSVLEELLARQRK